MLITLNDFDFVNKTHCWTGQLRATMKLTPEDGKFYFISISGHLSGMNHTYLLHIIYKLIQLNLDNLTLEKLKTSIYYS